MNGSRTKLWAVLVAACLAAPAVAADYADLAESAKSSFEPLTAQDLGAARARLSERVIAAERLLNPGTSFGGGWLEYLEWQGVTKQLGQSAEPDIAAAKETLRLLGSGAPGLEKPELQRLAEALEDYIGVASFAPADAERQRRSFELTVDGLAERVADLDVLNTARGSHEAERRLALLTGLEASGRGVELARGVRNGFSRPNLLVDVQSPLLNRLAARPVNDVGPLRDVILGTRICGTGATSGTLSVSTVPSVGRARLLFRLAGTTRSNTTGVNGPVSIRSVGDTSFHATKVVELANETFRVLPADASATTRTRTQSVSKIGGGLGSRLIERIARQRVAEKKGQADAIAGGRAEARVEARLNQQLNDEIVDARRRYDESVTRPMRQRRATPRSISYSTTSDSLLVEAVQADAGQLAAWDSPPPGVAAPLSARLHQTAVNNLLDDYLGGATLRRDSVDEPTKMDIVAPPWLKLKVEQPEPGERFQPWALTFRYDRPVSVELHEGRLKAILHAERIRVEDKTYDNWDLVAVYEPQVIDGAWRLVRQGKVDVLPTRFDPASGGRLTSTEVGLRNNLIDALNDPPDRIPQTIEIDPIDLTSRGGRIRFLTLQDLHLMDGWMAAGWDAQ